MKNFEQILLLAGTVLPLIGTGLTVLLASISRGRLRWTFLYLIPGLTLIACWASAGRVWQDGNMLAAGLFIFYLIIVFIYYPILTVTGLIVYRNNRTGGPSGDPV
jgi:hypothetical protein